MNFIPFGLLLFEVIKLYSFVVICTLFWTLIWIWHHLWVQLASIGTFGSGFG